MKKFKSPQHKLIAFFEKSRDNWKKRSEGYRAKLESIRSKVRSLERSRDNWKEKYQQLAEQLSLEKTAVICTGTQTDRSTGTVGPSIRSEIRVDTAKVEHRSGKVKKNKGYN